MVVFRKVTVTMLTVLFASVSVAIAAPLAMEGKTADKVAAGVAGVNQPVATEAVVAHQASAFALVQNTPAKDIVENPTSGGPMNSVPLSPALLLFGGALGAIFWLGRRRKAENSNWE